MNAGSGLREVPARTAAVAADTALAVARADKRRATSLATLSNQAAPTATATRGSYITTILRETATSYRVRWSQPEGNPTESNVGKRWMNTLAEYAETVIRFREQQPRRRAEQVVVSDNDTSTDSGSDSDEDVDVEMAANGDQDSVMSDAEPDVEPDNDSTAE